MDKRVFENTDLASADYTITESAFERRLTTLLLRLLFRKCDFALDFGKGDIRPMSASGYSVAFAPPRFWTLMSVLINPGLKFGEAYMDGHWYLTKGEMADFLLMLVTSKGGSVKRQGLTFGLLQALVHYYKQFITTFTATRQVARHYDVNTRLYKLMIGDDLVYSSAFFENGIDDLGAAQQQKFDTIFRRMQLRGIKTPKVLDIGCGWGSFEQFFPKDLMAEIDAISISGSQIAYAQSQTQAFSHAGKVKINFLKEDYRDFCARNNARYDRVVSIGMLEHVGRSKYKHYFNAIKHVLTEDGIALIHSIVMHEPGSTNLWIDRYIFPGGYAPMVSEVVHGIERAGLRIKAVHTHDGRNYIRTLQHWLANLRANETAILDLLADEQTGKPQVDREKIAKTTFRMFEFYLSATQLMFQPSYGGDSVAHFIVTR